MKLEKTKNIALIKAFSDIKLKFNIDQGEIAKRLGNNETYISEVLNGRKPLSLP